MPMQDDPKHIYTKTDDGSMARASHIAGENPGPQTSRPGQDASGQGRNGTDADALLRSTVALLRSRRDELADGFMLNQYWEGDRNALTEIIYLLDDGDPSGIDEVMARRDEEERSSQATLSGNGGDIDPSEEKVSPLGSGREPGIGTDDAAGPLDGIDAPVDLMSWPRFYPTRQRRDKWQSMKVLEEAAEVHAAAKDYIKEETGHDTMGRSMDDVRRELVDEVADLLQTTANLMAAYGVTPEELDGARTRNIGKNRSRGMFEDGPRTHMNRDDE